MNKYITLLKNTSIFAIGTFGAKVLTFLMMPFYTRVLTTEDFGVVDLIVNTANFIIPIVTICIADAILRYGLDRAVNKKDVFSTGILVLICGYLIFLLFIPIFLCIPIISNYTLLIYVFILTSSLNSICSQFVRARGFIKLYAISGILNTALMIISNLILLLCFNLGINGYVLSIIIADFLTSMFLFWIAGLKKYLKFQRISKSIAKAMVIFSLPLIPTTLFWWVTNLSDRYLVTYMIGADANGLYSAAYKIPTFITMLAGIVLQAWKISSVEEDNSADRARFYTNVFESYQSVIYLAASFIIILIKPITSILVSQDFYESWRFVPFLMMSVVFQCFASFLSNIYMVVKKNKMSMVTTLISAVVNVVLNLIFIPLWGVNGAAFATFISCFVLFITRVFNTQQFIRFNMKLGKVTINSILLLAQALIMIAELPYWVIYEIVLCAVVTVINLKPFIDNARKILRLKKKA